jgi:hypothetical protein
MGEGSLKLRRINDNNAFCGEANLGDGNTRHEIFIMKELSGGWHLGIRNRGYFYFKQESDLDGTYGPLYLCEKLSIYPLSEGVYLQRLLKNFFEAYRHDELSTGYYFLIKDSDDDVTQS